MPGNLTLTTEQLDEFDRRGVVRLAGLFSHDRVRRAREYVQIRLASGGLWKNGAWSLSNVPRPQWPATGLRPSKAIGNKHPDVEALLEEPALLAAVNILLDGADLEHTLCRRPQVLFEITQLLRREAFLSELYTEAPTDERARLLGQTGSLGDVALQVMELTGSRGDAYLMDLRVLHTAAPNAADHPRIMATHRFIRADVMQELTGTPGWG